MITNVVEEIFTQLAH